MLLLPSAPSLAGGHSACPLAGSAQGSGEQRGSETPFLLPCRRETMLQCLSRQHHQELRRLPGERSRVFLLDIFRLEFGLKKFRFKLGFQVKQQRDKQ